MRWLLPTLALTLAACGADDATTAEPASSVTGPTTADSALAPDPDAGDVNAPVELEAPTLDRPARQTVTVSVEGEPTPIGTRLVRFEDVPLPFSTYVPEGWAEDVVGSGEGTAVRLTMGEPPRQGVWTLFVPASTNDAATLARAVAESRGEAQPIDAGPPWTTEGFSFAGDGALGTVRVGEHAGTAFYVLREFPGDLGDGFSPRAALVEQELRWLDDGTGL